MISNGALAVRYNREDFGYIVGYPDGRIILVDDRAGALLEQGAPFDQVAPLQIETLDVRPGFHLNTPVLVWIELTRRCNLNCDHCYIFGGDARQDEMPVVEFRRLLDEMAEMGVWAVAFTGGEPTLHPNFVELVIYARAKGLLVGIATNGMFLTDELIQSLPTDGVIISVSLDNLHIPAHQGSREFQLVTDAILRCKNHGFLTNIMTNTHRKNIEHIRPLVRWAESHGVSVRSVPFSPIGRGKQHRDLQNTAEDVGIAAEFWIQECQWEHEYHKKAGLCVGTIFNYGLSLAYMTRRCSSGRYLCYVCADGTLFPCTMCAGESILSPGTTRNRPFADAWRSHWEIRSYSWDNFQSTCNTCPINDPAYYCASRCPAMSHAANGTFFGCGASEFEKLSTVYRTAILERTQAGKSSNLPISQEGENGRVLLPILEQFGF